MKTRLMNMVKINDKDSGQVLILDKVKKHGWEGLTFPGGKVEEGESMIDAVIREAKEETNLDIKNPTLVGIISWQSKDRLDMGLLYEAFEYEGELVCENREGRLFFMDYDKFKLADGKSKSMDNILKIYDGIYKEIYWDIEKDQVKYYK